MDIAAIIPTLGGTAFTFVAFVVALSVIVAVHEYGHYIVGRWSGIHAEVFSLGFGPVLWSRMDRRGTRWQVAAIPFGGYVKFLGDADAASAGEDEDAVAELTPEQRRHTMAGAPLWARAATVAAGPVFNFILSILIYAGLVMAIGQTREPMTIGSFEPLPGVVNELRPGDEILSMGGVVVTDESGKSDFTGVREQLPKEPVLTYLVRRDGVQREVRGPYPFPPLVSELLPLSAAADAGLQVGDVVTAVDGAAIFDFDQLKQKVEAATGAPLKLDVWRDGQISEFVLKPRRVDEPQADGGFKTEWRIGIAGRQFFEPARDAHGPIEALKRGAQATWDIIARIPSSLYSLVTGAISSCNMAGPITMAQVSGHMASQGAENFISFIALISTAIGLFNLFPIPVLDGGHLVFYAYEAVFRRPAPQRVHMALMAVGLFVVLSLMLFALGNDIVCWLMRKELL
ncbi:RIP metalloprotease RseP [Marimonas arenosa]|uniref:Zinc metalloprotease n=1 Tax=Marimonas arenosa TaxID=1795305 RepID=A0AAE3WB88_9RHOB|nr:RIP metalloprotease RseP [Marimonas arenosa]MDQ2088510.1 RIP metalloprotease RseP [Marimonas arenosa]